MLVIGGKFRHHPLISPKGDKTRPTASRLRETVFNIVQQEIEGADFLDIFAGSGAMGIEALSRGANSATFIDLSREAFKALESNLQKLKIAQEATLMFGDYQKMLEKLKSKGAQFDVIFADAPYNMIETGNELLLAIKALSLLKSGGLLLIENNQENLNAPPEGLKWIRSRRSGAAYLHQYRNLL